MAPHIVLSTHEGIPQKSSVDLSVLHKYFFFMVSFRYVYATLQRNSQPIFLVCRCCSHFHNCWWYCSNFWATKEQPIKRYQYLVREFAKGIVKIYLYIVDRIAHVNCRPVPSLSPMFSCNLSIRPGKPCYKLFLWCFLTFSRCLKRHREISTVWRQRVLSLTWAHWYQLTL